MPEINNNVTPVDDQPAGDGVLVGYDALVAMRRDHHVPAPAGKSATLAERFLLPPFSVLDARQGYWQKRKRAWLAIGIQSELGRGEGTADNDTGEWSNRMVAEGKLDSRRAINIIKPIVDNGLLGFSEQARTHYKDGKTVRGDGRGRPLAQTYGSGGPGDLAAGFREKALDGGAGRGDNLVAGGHSDQSINIDFYAKKRKLEVEFGGELSTDEAREILLERGEIRQKVDRTNKGKKTNRLAPGGTGANSCWLGTAGPVGENGINKKADNRAFKDHEWLVAHGKKVPQMGVGTPVADASPYNCYDDSDDTSRRNAAAQPQSGTSIFDPVICELAYRWFTPSGGRVLDPFAGGSVRGVVAARLGRSYVGLDLRPEQCEANRVQADLLCPGADLVWHAADSTGVDAVAPGEYDMVFSCPPYSYLERYSDDPRDISTMTYADFLAAYRVIITKSCAMLKDDRFVCFVVGDVRDKRGNYLNFVGDTVNAFRDAGLHLYNSAVLVTSVGSLPIRVGRQFESGRKLGTTHQHVLVFVKGDGTRATAACGGVDLADLDMPDLWQPGTLAVPVADLAGVEGAGELLAGRSWSDGGDAVVLDAPPDEAALVCDILRGRARGGAESTVRVYVAGESSWEVLPDAADLCHVSEGRAWLNAELFPDAERPPCDGDAVPVVFGGDVAGGRGPGLVGGD